MKKIYLFVFASVMMLFTACHDKIWDAIDDLDARVAKLEELCKEMNTNISSLQTIVSVLQENDYITGILPIEKGGETIGYTITFGKHDPITIYNGEDGKDGTNGSNGQGGYTPILGVAKDTDGIYYWTLNGEWLLDAEGNKVRVTGEDGKNGADGKDGQDGIDGENGVDGQPGKDGVNGKDGITPKLKIENGYWYVSYDNEVTWIELGKAVGENGEDGKNGQDGKPGTDGQPGKDGVDGDSMFSNVTYDDNNVYFTLTNGTILIVPRGNIGESGEVNPSDIIEFKDLNVKKALMRMNIDTNGDGEISYGEAAAYTGSILMESNTNILSFKEFQYFTGVTSISFKWCKNLFEVVLPNTIDTIGNSAFEGCSSLTSIEIPNSVTSIGDRTFCSCSSLTSIEIPNSVTLIGGEVFCSCSSLTSIKIPNNVTSIEDGAFYYCSSLTSVTIPNSVTSIGNSAFSYCRSLISITIPNSVTSIGKSAFAFSSLSLVYSKNPIPPTLGGDVFDITKIGVIYVPAASVDVYKSKSGWSSYASKIVGYDF